MAQRTQTHDDWSQGKNDVSDDTTDMSISQRQLQKNIVNP